MPTEFMAGEELDNRVPGLWLALFKQYALPDAIARTLTLSRFQALIFKNTFSLKIAPCLILKEVVK